jgi:hypothetical protein
MLLRKIGKIALFDQLDDVPVAPMNGRDELLLVRRVIRRRVVWATRMFMVFVVMMMVVTPMIVFVRMIMILVMLVF